MLTLGREMVAMKKLTVDKNTYYQNKWENNGFLIIELCVDKSYRGKHKAEGKYKVAFNLF